MYAYDFKLYRKYEDKGVSLTFFLYKQQCSICSSRRNIWRSFSYNGHAKKDEAFRNDMTNFGILMEVQGIDKPFDWSRDVVKKLQ